MMKKTVPRWWFGGGLFHRSRIHLVNCHGKMRFFPENSPWREKWLMNIIGRFVGFAIPRRLIPPPTLCAAASRVALALWHTDGRTDGHAANKRRGLADG